MAVDGTFYDLAIDFDGVLCRYEKGYTGPRPVEKPVGGARQFIEDALNADMTVIVFSHRAATAAGKRGIIEWLIEHDFPEIEVTDKKPAARLYPDDRGYRFDGDFDKLFEFAVDKQATAPWYKQKGDDVKAA